MKLGRSKFLSSLRIKTQILKRLQRVIVVDGTTPKKMVRSVAEAPWRLEQRSLCCSCAALSWFCGLVSSQYLIMMRWISRWRMLRSLGWCCLEKVDLLVAAGGAVEVLPVSLSCPLPLLRAHPPSLLVCCFFVFAETNTASERLGGKPIFVWEAVWKEPLWYNPSFSCIGN